MRTHSLMDIEFLDSGASLSSVETFQTKVLCSLWILKQFKGLLVGKNNNKVFHHFPCLILNKMIKRMKKNYKVL